jgi:Acetyltransferase (GNAT) domain
MHEALQAILEFGFGELDLNRIEADIDPRNGASARTLERLGFTKEGYLRERWIVGDEVSDTALYGLLRREWHSRPRAIVLTRWAPRRSSGTPGHAVLRGYNQHHDYFSQTHHARQGSCTRQACGRKEKGRATKAQAVPALPPFAGSAGQDSGIA